MHAENAPKGGRLNPLNAISIYYPTIGFMWRHSGTTNRSDRPLAVAREVKIRSTFEKDRKSPFWDSGWVIGSSKGAGDIPDQIVRSALSGHGDRTSDLAIRTRYSRHFGTGREQ